MQSKKTGSLTLECLKMGRTTFAYSNLLNATKVNAFIQGPTGTNRFDVQYWSCHVEQTYDDPEKRNVKGMVMFEVKQELQDVKQWFISVFGNMLCEHLSVKEHEQEIILYEQNPPPHYYEHKMYQKYGYRMDLNGWDDEIY